MDLLAARGAEAPKAARDAAHAGYAYVVLDGALIPIDRVSTGRVLLQHGMNL